MKTEVKKALRQDFLAFASKALRELNGTVVSEDRYLELLATHLTDLAEGRAKRLLVNMPARHLKTYLCSVSLAAWILAQKPKTSVMIVTYSQDLSESISRDIRSILQASWFKEVFNTRIAKGHARVNDFATTDGGKLYAVAFDGSITGFGADIIIVDDPHNVSDAGYPKRLKQTIETFYSNVLSRFNNRKKGRLVVVGHRVHELDLSAALLEDGDWTHIALPMIAPRDQSYQTAYGTWHRKKDDLLRPDAYDLAEIKNLRLRNVNPCFELLYQQDADGQSLPSLTPHHFMSYDLDRIQTLPHFISVDPGVDEGDGRSFSVVQLWASNGDNHFLVNQFRKRCDFPTLVAMTKSFAKSNVGAPILIENTANGPALISALSKRQQRRTHAVTPRSSKKTRFRRHVEKLLTGRVRIRKDAPFRSEFIGEVVQFPHGQHDDQVDAMTQFLDWLVRQDDIDFSRTNVTRSGTMALGLNSQPQLSSCPQQLDPKAPGIMAGGRPQMPNGPFLVVRAWIQY